MTAPTEQDRRFPALNAVRAVAALGVVATHTAFDTGEVGRGWTGAFLSRLDFGVTLFFVLSGFLLSRPFFLIRAAGGNHPSYLHFVWKRALRILPLYWLTVVLALGLLPENGGVGGGGWLRDLTLTQIYEPGLLHTGLTQMWSLCTEVAFYAVLPGLCWLLFRLTAGSGWRPRRLLVALASLAAGGFAWQVLAASSSHHGEHYAQWLPGFVPWFAIGMAFAVISADHALHPGPRRWTMIDRLGDDLPGCWLLAAAVFAIACTPIAGPRLLTSPTGWEAMFKHALYAVTAAFLVLPLVFGPERAGLARRLASSSTMVWLGDISYGIFCLHLLALETVLDARDVEIFTGRFTEVFLLTVFATVAMSAVSFYVMERPLLRLKNVGPFARREVAATARASSSTG